MQIQSIAGSFLYYTQALDYTLLLAINETLTTQAKPALHTFEQCQQILDYVATYPNACIRYHTSDIILLIDSNAAYLIMPQAKSRIADYYYLSNYPEKTPHPAINGTILVECKALRHVVFTSTEATNAGVFRANCTSHLPYSWEIQLPSTTCTF